MLSRSANPMINPADRVLFIDAEAIVIDKPAGPAAADFTLSVVRNIANWYGARNDGVCIASHSRHEAN